MSLLDLIAPGLDSRLAKMEQSIVELNRFIRGTDSTVTCIDRNVMGAKLGVDQAKEMLLEALNRIDRIEAVTSELGRRMAEPPPKPPTVEETAAFNIEVQKLMYDHQVETAKRVQAEVAHELVAPFRPIMEAVTALYNKLDSLEVEPLNPPQEPSPVGKPEQLKFEFDIPATPEEARQIVMAFDPKDIKVVNKSETYVTVKEIAVALEKYYGVQMSWQKVQHILRSYNGLSTTTDQNTGRMLYPYNESLRVIGDSLVSKPAA